MSGDGPRGAAWSSRRRRYRDELAALDDWETYLRANSGLPGPRANLELVQAVADAGNLRTFERFAASEDEFLVVCGCAGLGRLVAEGRLDLLDRLRQLASDPRWRVREGVVMGLQRLGDANVERLLEEMEKWAGGGPLEQRAAVAALCEPRLLRQPARARRVLALVDRVTRSFVAEAVRNAEPWRVLRKGLGYCWSVAAAALPEEGRDAMERWIGSSDPDVRWVMRQNLAKARIRSLGAAWVEAARKRVAG